MKPLPHIIINPLSGEPKPKKSGDGVTFRGDACVQSFKYCLVEFDDLTREEQIRFWTSPDVQRLPIAALVDTGGKSIHAWIRTTGIHTAADWQREIETKLYDQVMVPLGVDPNCKNPARLSRLPGQVRDNKYQRLLWLNMPLKEGK